MGSGAGAIDGRCGAYRLVAESQKKGALAAAATVATVAAGVALGPVVAAVAAVPTVVLGYRWWRHRAENGIKF